MPRSITIQGSIIEFPEPGDSPDWGQAVEDFAVAVEGALSGVAGAYDVSPQVMNIDAYNPASSATNITNLSFTSSNVRAAVINMAVYRNTNSVTVTEMSTIWIVYNASNGSGQKWEITQQRTGDASTVFTVTDTGQVQFLSNTISGTSHNGILSYSAKALLNS